MFYIDRVPNLIVTGLPLTPAVRQRRCRERIKADPEKYEKYKKMKRDSYHANKRLAKDLSSNEKSIVREIWRARKQEQRCRKKGLSRVIKVTLPSSSSVMLREDIAEPNDVVAIPQITPPVSPVPVNMSDRRRGKKKLKLNKKITEKKKTRN